MRTRQKIIIYIFIPLLFILFLIGKIYKLIKEFYNNIKEGIDNCDFII